MRAAEHFAPLQTATTVTVGSRFLTDAHSTSITTAPVPTNSAIADNTVHTIGHCLYPAKFTYLVGGAAVPSVIRLMFTSVVNVVVMVKVQYYVS